MKSLLVTARIMIYLSLFACPLAAGVVAEKLFTLPMLLRAGY